MHLYYYIKEPFPCEGPFEKNRLPKKTVQTVDETV